MAAPAPVQKTGERSASAGARRGAGRRLSTLRLWPRVATGIERLRAQRRGRRADRGRGRPSRGLPRRAQAGAAAAGAHRLGRGRAGRARRRRGLRHRRDAAGADDHPHRRRRRRVRGLPRRTLRSGEPLLRLSADQLHPLRPALYADARAPLRPRADFDGAVPDVRGLRPGLPRSDQPPLPRRADRLSPLRPEAQRADRGRRVAAEAGRNRRAEGPRRFPPPLRRP